MIGDNIVRGGQRHAFQQEQIIMDGMKNISKAEVLTLRDQVAYQSGQVVSRTLAQNEHVSVTLFSFDKGEEISTHESGPTAAHPASSAMRHKPSIDRAGQRIRHNCIPFFLLSGTFETKT